MSVTQFPNGFRLKNILTSFLWSKLIDHSKLSSICYFSVILLRAFFRAVITFWKKRHVYIREFKGSATTTATAMKTSLKKWIRAASNSIALISPSRSVHELLVKFMEFVWIWILKDYIEVQEKKNVTVLRCPSSTKREIWYFHVLFGQRWQRNVRKSMLHVRSSVWFCLSKLIAYFTSTTVTAVL